MSRSVERFFAAVFWRKIPRLLRPSFYFAPFGHLIRYFAGTQGRRRRIDLLFGIPAVLVLLGTAAAFAVAESNRRNLTASYMAAGTKAMNNEDYAKANMLFSRVLANGGTSANEAQYQMGVLLEETGQIDRAQSIFELVAPRDDIGIRSAHRRLAIYQADNIDESTTTEDIKTLKWHLDAAGRQNDALLDVAWGRYYLATNQLPDAAVRFRRAVDQHPELWRFLGLIDVETGQLERAKENFERAQTYMVRRLESHPEDLRTRRDLATVQVRLGDFDTARQTLEAGLRLEPDGDWKYLLANLTVLLHDAKVRSGNPLSDSFGLLLVALKYDPNHPAALNRLMSYVDANPTKNQSVRQVLAAVLAEGKQPAMAHLALGNVCFKEGNARRATFHFEQALQLRDDLAIVMNNLAWMLAHQSEKPDLERALSLIEVAIEKSPGNPRFLDTRGTIYIKQKRWRDAITDLEQTVDSVPDRSETHRKLATAYKNLGMEDIADQHLAKAMR